MNVALALPVPTPCPPGWYDQHIAADPAAWRAGWAEMLTAWVVSRIVDCAHTVEPSRDWPGYDGRALSDTEYDAVVVADRLLTAVADIPGVADRRGCDACNRSLTTLSVDWAECSVLAGFRTHAEEGLAFCPFCQLLFAEEAVHAPTMSDQALTRAAARLGGSAERNGPSYQRDHTLAAVHAELDRRGLPTSSPHPQPQGAST